MIVDIQTNIQSIMENNVDNLRSYYQRDLNNLYRVNYYYL